MGTDQLLEESMGTTSGMTPKQESFIRSLLEERELTGEQKAVGYDRLPTLSRKQASAWIEKLLELPRKQAANNDDKQPSIPDVPAGRYAIENADGELRFYKVWIGRTGFVKMYVLHGPEESEVYFKSMVSILGKIQEAGIRECAIRYGNEIGACSNCGRRLTNRISRELGIGPVCGGRMFGDEFKDDVKAARQAIVDRGEDPNEDVLEGMTFEQLRNAVADTRTQLELDSELDLNNTPLEELSDQLDGVLREYNTVTNLASLKPEYGGPSTLQERERMEEEARCLAKQARTLECIIQERS